ncbi:hypothetical protein [Paragemmobacter straminiformis]|uniref:Uncharacterized protein n=1 Tax=Paragemmobacter straminiformis TaxID=2045119 RepID=A0A842I4D2_9RHOB|nr:hypothetical protein [Gemmobacter straminiformis]MBC2834004.1 hypothetical protein [Gemmobacter straminiformis]
MRPAPFPALLFALSLALLSGCAHAGAKTVAPGGPPPRLLPLEEILPAPIARTSAQSADALDARGAALRAQH